LKQDKQGQINLDYEGQNTKAKSNKNNEKYNNNNKIMKNGAKNEMKEMY